MIRATAIRQIFGESWRALRKQFGRVREKKLRPVADRESLCWLLETRSSHMAQTALYGYLRTRMGARFPELFTDDRFVVSINIAKWQIWLACLSDLAVYVGGAIYRTGSADDETVGRILADCVEQILVKTGVPEDSGESFEVSASRVRKRVTSQNWAEVGEGEAAFTESPSALVEWAPVLDSLKQLDEEIVRNSVRFRWREVRAEVREMLRPEALLSHAPGL